MTSPNDCGTLTRTAPSREFAPKVFDNIDAPVVIADADPTRSYLAVVALSANTVDVDLITSTSGPAGGSKRWPLTPGEGYILTTSAQVVVRSSVAGTPCSVKVMIERGAVG